MEFIEEEAGARDKVQIIALNTKIWSFYSRNSFCLIWAPHRWTLLSVTRGAVSGFEQRSTIKKRDVSEELRF